jgi:hypothetical protein
MLTSQKIDDAITQRIYDTQSLIALFRELEEQGYSALGMGLIIDLIERDAKEV